MAGHRPNCLMILTLLLSVWMVVPCLALRLRVGVMAFQAYMAEPAGGGAAEQVVPVPADGWDLVCWGAGLTGGRFSPPSVLGSHWPGAPGSCTGGSEVRSLFGKKTASIETRLLLSIWSVAVLLPAGDSFCHTLAMNSPQTGVLHA